MLGLLVARWFLLETRRTGVRILVLLPALVAGAYGITDEVHQSFVEGRQASVLDGVADAVGATLAVGVFALLAGGRSAARDRAAINVGERLDG